MCGNKVPFKENFGRVTFFQCESDMKILTDISSNFLFKKQVFFL